MEGRCKALDASADGYARAEACALMALCLTSSLATAQGISSSAAPAAALLFLSGSAVNQDGRSSALTAPNGPSQQQVLGAALRDAGAQPGSVALLQLHGTGEATPVIPKSAHPLHCCLSWHSTKSHWFSPVYHRGLACCHCVPGVCPLHALVHDH